jgi:hypothetical protein
MRFFFNLHECGPPVHDEEGRELPDAAAARDHALKDARSVMASEVQAGRLCLSCRIDVVDESQRPILSVSFKEAVEVTGL